MIPVRAPFRSLGNIEGRPLRAIIPPFIRLLARASFSRTNFLTSFARRGLRFVSWRQRCNKAVVLLISESSLALKSWAQRI